MKTLKKIAEIIMRDGDGKNLTEKEWCFFHDTAIGINHADEYDSYRERARSMLFYNFGVDSGEKI